MLTPALTKRRKWSRKIPLRQLVAHREVLKQIISGWNNSREGNSSFLLYHNLIFLRFSPSLSQCGFSHAFIPAVGARWFFVTSAQQFSPAGQTPVLPCYLFASLIILWCNLVWIFKVALMSCSQAAVTQGILMKLTEIDSYSFTEAAGQWTGSRAGKSFSFGRKNTKIPLASQTRIFATCCVSGAGGCPCPHTERQDVAGSPCAGQMIKQVDSCPHPDLSLLGVLIPRSNALFSTASSASKLKL